MSMNFFRCRFCGITQAEVYITDEKMTQLLSCCPGCGADHFAEGYADEVNVYEDEELDASSHEFHEGDAVVGYDGEMEYRGVIVGIYDDVVDIEYMTRFGMETMDFHVDHVEAV